MPSTPQEASSSHFLSIAEHEKCGRAFTNSVHHEQPCLLVGINMKIIPQLQIGPYIHINIDPVLLRLGPLALHWYGLMYVVNAVPSEQVWPSDVSPCPPM